MPALDPKQVKANVAVVKTALRKAMMKTSDGKTARVGFAFAPGKDKKDHILVIDPRKKAQALMMELKKHHTDRKVLCCGTATVIKDGGKFTLSIIYVKKLAGAERKIQEAMKAMALNYMVKLEKDEEDEDVSDDDSKLELVEEIEEAVEEAIEGVEARHRGGEEEEPTAEADDEEEEEGEEGEGEKEDKEEDEEEEERPAAASSEKGAAPPSAKLAALKQAPQVWHQTRHVMSANIDKLKSAIKDEYANESPEMLAELDKSMGQMQRILDKLDHKLADSMDKAHQAEDEGERQKHLKDAKAMLAEHIKYVQTEPLIAHIDANPFGVQANLKKTLMASFTHLAKTIS
jgi:hypothetical protein